MRARAWSSRPARTPAAWSARPSPSSAAGFMQALVAAMSETGATIAFDAIGGGKLAGQILTGMEAAAVKKGGGAFSRYGSTTFKQVYIYGGLDTGPTELNRAFGMQW